MPAAKYQLTENPNEVIRLDDNTKIPHGHRWWDDYEAWLAEGNQPLPIDAEKITKESLIAAIASMRYDLEVAGTSWNGIPVFTDRDSRSVLTSAIVTGQLLGSWPQGWKFADGQFRAVTGDELKAVALAVKQHVDAAFMAEAGHGAAIATLSDQAAIDAYDVSAGWPA
ncbi:DUF4376 domain-containing protein [Chitinibacter sp. S2-10]|uniref:DUF4376 domain-containing protein n=1 Tax=Chitinibacter sp. S2-10 TaxID=3373597 RepID=UPI00397783FD